MKLHGTAYAGFGVILTSEGMITSAYQPIGSFTGFLEWCSEILTAWYAALIALYSLVVLCIGSGGTPVLPKQKYNYVSKSM